MPDLQRSAVHGAVYIPARAYNAPQMWRDYDADEVRRDMGYARRVGLNAFRLWASYEFWLVEPDAFGRRFDDLLTAADEHSIGVLVSLFENCGVPPTEESMWTTDPQRAFCIRSPHPDEVVRRPSEWGPPARFVRWFMDRYRDDARLIGIELMNEPGTRDGSAMPFARRMLETAIGARGEVPLTMGCSSLAVSRVYADLGIELLQFHHNFPGSEQELRRHIESALQLQEELARPIWFTEVQRVRAVSGWGDEQPPGEDLSPDLASVVPVVQEYGLPWFFWSLMVKRAYLPAQRAKGTVNGLFWEDGAVWSLADARAVAGDAELVLEERAEGL